MTTNSTWTEHAKGLIIVESNNPREAGQLTTDEFYARRVEPADLWASFKSAGIFHGPAFQNIKSIQAGKDRSVSTIAVASTRDEVRILHPTTLDSIFQVAYTTLPGAGSDEVSSMIPRTIKKLWVSPEIGRKEDRTFRAYSVLTHSDSQKFEAAVSLVCDDPKNPLPILQLDGLVCQSMGSGPIMQPSQTAYDLCAALEWEPDISFSSTKLPKAATKFSC